jgi:glutamate-1-semialdehyde 2,1-aminomutase
VFVELAELLVDVVDHADWAMLAKNGSDATTLCLTLARAHTGRRTILVAQGAYHGALPWCTPLPTGVVPGDRAHLVYFRYNDLEDMQRVLAEHRGDVAGVIVCPFRHDAGFDQELVDPEFAHGLRAACDEHDALLILDDVRAGFRMAYGSSWEPLGVRPDLSAWSKAIGNGHPIAAVLGSEAVRSAAQSVFATGSFWMSATAMAAAIATIKALKREDGLATMQERGQQLCEGLRALAAERGLAVNVTGPATMPYMTFADDPQRRRGELFASVCAEHGAFLHPRHNWFLSAQHTRSDIEAVLAASVRAFDAVLEA